MVWDLLINKTKHERSLVMSDRVIFDKTLQMIEDRLSLSSMNQKLISSNLANINTPGYQSKELSFENTLRQSLEEQVLQMVRSNSNHMAPDEPFRQCETRRWSTPARWTWILKWWPLPKTALNISTWSAS